MNPRLLLQFLGFMLVGKRFGLVSVAIHSGSEIDMLERTSAPTKSKDLHLSFTVLTREGALRLRLGFNAEGDPESFESRGCNPLLVATLTA